MEGGREELLLCIIIHNSVYACSRLHPMQLLRQSRYHCHYLILHCCWAVCHSAGTDSYHDNSCHLEKKEA